MLSLGSVMSKRVVVGHHCLFPNSTVLANKRMQQTGREGVAHSIRRGPVVEARPAADPQCSTDL